MPGNFEWYQNQAVDVEGRQFRRKNFQSNLSKWPSKSIGKPSTPEIKQRSYLASSSLKPHLHVLKSLFDTYIYGDKALPYNHNNYNYQNLLSSANQHHLNGYANQYYSDSPYDISDWSKYSPKPLTSKDIRREIKDVLEHLIKKGSNKISLDYSENLDYEKDQKLESILNTYLIADDQLNYPLQSSHNSYLLNENVYGYNKPYKHGVYGQKVFDSILTSLDEAKLLDLSSLSEPYHHHADYSGVGYNVGYGSDYYPQHTLGYSHGYEEHLPIVFGGIKHPYVLPELSSSNLFEDKEIEEVKTDKTTETENDLGNIAGLTKKQVKNLALLGLSSLIGDDIDINLSSILNFGNDDDKEAEEEEPVTEAPTTPTENNEEPPENAVLSALNNLGATLGIPGLTLFGPDGVSTIPPGTVINIGTSVLANNEPEESEEAEPTTITETVVVTETSPPTGNTPLQDALISLGINPAPPTSLRQRQSFNNRHQQTPAMRNAMNSNINSGIIPTIQLKSPVSSINIPPGKSTEILKFLSNLNNVYLKMKPKI